MPVRGKSQVPGGQVNDDYFVDSVVRDVDFVRERVVSEWEPRRRAVPPEI